MNLLSNEMMFYGGLGVVVIAILAAVIFTFVYKIKKIRLMSQLEREYGK